MTYQRYDDLMRGAATLTPEEIKEGWHFCPEWDGLLVSPELPEVEACTCHETQP